ncbi:Os08g0328500 [Oryza sativa Japonica Group]|nr:Os08g0328500 [Oryza sativa Japonica Group]
MVDTRRKTMPSVPPFLHLPFNGETLVSRFSSYFNSNHSSNNGGGGGGGALPSKIHVNIEPPPPPAAVATGEPRTSDTAEPKIVLVLERFSWRLKGYSIQDMAGGDDMLKAYTILSQDNGRCFRSLLGLPMSFNFELGLAVDDDQE